MRRSKKLMLTAIAVSLAAMPMLAPAASARDHLPISAPAAAEPLIPTLTAIGSATIFRTPDQAVVSLGAATVGKTSTEAQDKLNKALESIVAAVKSLTLPNLKVQTQWLSLNPVYEQIDYREPQTVQREPKIIGYNASNTVRVTVGDVTKAGQIIDTAIGAGANQVHGLSFELKDDAASKGEALRAAAKDAQAKAAAMADALGLRVLRIVEVHSGAMPRPMPMYRALRAPMHMKADSAEMAQTVLEPGEVSVSEQVTVTVEVAEK